ncbi:MAG TPA: mannose-1-phosphate guanylyltransferase/mannose-6-phosphate isomerase [Rhodocyclaceae bacterium]
MARLIPVILSGGAGTRLWPVSREMHPKPFIRLADGQSLLQKTFLRGAMLPDVEAVLTVTNREHYFKSEDEFLACQTAPIEHDYVLEPFGRNTAGAIAAAALVAAERYGDDACLLVLAADHIITDQAAFATAVASARKAAEQGALVTFGIRPERPETGFGYIEAGPGTEGAARPVKRFVEKPSLEVAQQYLAAGSFYWNSGMFCFSAATALAELAVHAPAVLAAVRPALAHGRRTAGERLSSIELDAGDFAAVPDISIDYALMEKSAKVQVVPCDIGWSDIGSWTALAALEQADDRGNRIVGEALLEDVSNCYIQSLDRVVGAVGVSDLIVVDTPDALLVARQDRAQDVRAVVQRLKAAGHESVRLHREVHRPWGTYTVLEEGPRFKIKRIVVKPGARLSLQLHHHRSEHWVVVSGRAAVINGEREIAIGANESTYIPANTQHRLFNPGDEDCVMIEVQVGDYVGEDDIVRLDDQYGRS